MHLRPVVLVAALSLSSLALAIKPGDPLFVVGPGVKLLKQPKAGSAPVTPKELAPGTAVTWYGAAVNGPGFHEVGYAGKRGYVAVGSVSTQRPEVELVTAPPATTAPATTPSTTSTSSSSAAPSFAASGAATKSEPPAPSPEQQKADAELKVIEQLNQQAAAAR